MASTSGERLYMAPTPGGVLPTDATLMTFGNPFATDDTVEQVGARYPSGMDGAWILVRREGERNAVTAPIYPAGQQYTRELVAAGFRTELQAATTIGPAADVEIRASVGQSHYLVSPTDLSAIGPRTSFGMFGWGTSANSTICYTEEGAIETTINVAASATVAFDGTLKQITGAASQLAGATAGGWIEVSGTASNNGRMRVLSQPDDNTINVDPDSFTVLTEAAGGAVTITGLHSVALADAAINDLATEAPGASVTIDFLKNEAGSATPTFAAVVQQPTELPTLGYQLYEGVFVDELAYDNPGSAPLAFGITLGSFGGQDPVQTNPFTGVISEESFDATNSVTRPTTSAHIAGPFGSGHALFFGGESFCMTELSWTLGNSIELTACAEEIDPFAADAGKPTWECTGMIYRQDNDGWVAAQRAKNFDHWQWRGTTSEFRDGVSGSAAVVVDIYRATLTSSGDKQTSIDAEAVEHEVTFNAGGIPDGSWGAVTFITHP